MRVVNLESHPGLESALNLQGDAMFKRQKKLDEYYTGRARCQAESASGAGFGASSCKTPRPGREKRPHFTPNKRLCEAGEELDAGAPSLSTAALLPFQVHRLHRQVPVGFEDFETLLLFSFVGFFVGK